MPIYNTDSRFFIYKSNSNNIEQIKNYNNGIKTKINTNSSCSDSDDKYLKVKENKIFCFPMNRDIKKGDIIFIFNDIKKGKYNRGFVKHIRAFSDSRLNTKNKDIFDDPNIQKYCFDFDLSYEYEEIFTLNTDKFKTNFNKETPIKTPMSFSKTYLNNPIFTFIELPFDVGTFMLNLILRKVKEVIPIIKKIDSKKIDSKKSESIKKNNDSDSDSSDNSDSDNSDNSDSESDNSESESSESENSDSDNNSDSYSDDESNENDNTDNSNDQFKDNKKVKGIMIPILIESCKYVKENITKMNARVYMNHYLECGRCISIDNNTIQLKYSYIKDKTKKEELKIVEFGDIDEEYEAYISMETPFWEKKPNKSTYIINYIKDSGSEYNRCVLINWLRVINK
jgi:hypothetical protein